MADNFNTYINYINADYWRELCEAEGVVRMYERGEEFVRIGEVCRYVGFVKQGTLKYVSYSDDGTEHVVGLEFAGEFVVDFPFSFYGLKSRVSIVAVTPCEILCVSVRHLSERMKSDSTLREVMMRSTEAVFSTVYDRYLALYCQTPQQRYDDLVSRHPDLFSMFSLKDIASFLNITPTHLSRLRKTGK